VLAVITIEVTLDQVDLVAEEVTHIAVSAKQVCNQVRHLAVLETQVVTVPHLPQSGVEAAVAALESKERMVLHLAVVMVEMVSSITLTA
jgi:phage head maturation protease